MKHAAISAAVRGADAAAAVAVVAAVADTNRTVVAALLSQQAKAVFRLL